MFDWTPPKTFSYFKSCSLGTKGQMISPHYRLSHDKGVNGLHIISSWILINGCSKVDFATERFGAFFMFRLIGFFFTLKVLVCYTFFHDSAVTNNLKSQKQIKQIKVSKVYTPNQCYIRRSSAGSYLLLLHQISHSEGTTPVMRKEGRLRDSMLFYEKGSSQNIQ